ncbi:flagellar basal body-associated FliL family protein [Methylomonas koyamae]|uniref:flagellar basal body-associated FliL family protein n=1 Tax=Methylomonas koyamae TaxID=702114 RepID=UPI00112D609B|nr:flagellar basal body-associated FliL family protein [Methylomonas koyamae]TPQ25012.1 flagellar basal body protein FliL [Methylomonas koyamae]
MAETQGKDEGKKSSKKLIIIIAVVVLALAGGGAAYFFLAKPAENGKEAADAKHGENKHAESSAHEAETDHDKPPEPDVYYAFPTPLLVDYPSGASARVIKISLTVLTKGEASIEAMKKHEPMIRNNLLMVISSVGADKAKTLEGKQELRAMMQQEIGKVLEKMAGKNTLKEVYFTDFIMQ